MEEEQQDPESISVSLTPIAGISPRVYVPILYALLAALLLFLLLILPGLRTNGTYLTVSSNPPNAALFVDGDYVGATPGTYFIEAGTRSLVVSRPAFIPSEETRTIRGRLFGSLFFPRRLSLQVVLEPDLQAADRLVENATRQFAQWAVAGEASSRYEFPPLARALSADLNALAAPREEIRTLWNTFLSASLPALASEALLLDLTSGTIAAESEASVATPAGIAALVSAVADAPSRLPVQLADFLRTEREAAIRESPWYAQAERGSAAPLPTVGQTTVGQAPRPPLSLGGLSWIPFGPAEIGLPGEAGADRGGEFSRTRSIPLLYVSQTEVPISLYQAFVSQRPLWAPENRDSLVAAGLVDRNYLETFALARENPALPITEVSAFAAEAFADWLGESIAADARVRLPTEDEWDVIAELSGPQSGVFAGDSPEGPLPVSLAGTDDRGVIGLLGNVWEWTATPFAHYSFLYPQAGPSVSDAQRVVRGGGWATEALGFSRYDRGAIPPDWTSAFTGIRLVLVIDR